MSRWRLFDWTFGLLTALVMMAAWEGYALNHRPETHGCGGDFPQFYIAGTIIRRGEAERLYDQPYFRHFQESMRDDPLRSLYPPTMGLLMAPWRGFPTTRHWAPGGRSKPYASLLAARFSTAPRHCRRGPAEPWRIAMLAALAALVPLWIAVAIGHLAPMLLLVLAGGLTLHERGKRGWAGLLLSLLALKPQLAAGLLLWMLLRRDLRTLLGLAAGFALQGLAVAVLLGPGLWLDYLHAMPEISAITRAYRYSPLFEQSFAGIASNLSWMAGLTAWKVPVMRIAYAVTASAAAVMLCRVVWAGSREQGAGSKAALPPACRSPLPAYEYACGVLFMMIFPPYFLVYDQTLVAVPLVMLWSSPAWRWGLALFATTTVLMANFSFTLGFSLTGLVALAAMFSLAKAAGSPNVCITLRAMNGQQADRDGAGSPGIFYFLKSRPRFQLTEQIASGKCTEPNQSFIPKPSGDRKGEKS